MQKPPWVIETSMTFSNDGTLVKEYTVARRYINEKGLPIIERLDSTFSNEKVATVISQILNGERDGY